MAFSLLDHLQTTQATKLQQLSDDKTVQRQMLATMLAQLVVRDRQDSAAVYQAIQQQTNAVLWQGAEPTMVEHLAKLFDMPAQQFKHMTEQLYNYVASEIKTIDDSANLAQAGVSELIQGQVDYLPNQAPDRTWDLLGLPELQGHTKVVEQPVELGATIASLSKMLHDASQVSQLQQGEHMHPINDTHQVIEPAYQRPAPHLFLVLEPIIAVIILVGLWIIYANMTGY